MALGNAAVFGCLGKGKHIPVIVQGNSHKFVDSCNHLPVAFMTGSLIGLKELGKGVDLIVGYGLDRHIADAHLVRVVGATALKPRAVHGYPGFHTNGYRHIHQFCRLQELLRAGNGVMVDDTGGTQALHPGSVDRCGGGVGGERVGGMDVVIDVLGHHRRENRGFQDLGKIVQPLRLGGGIELI